jgi:hypothetical protein
MCLSETLSIVIETDKRNKSVILFPTFNTTTRISTLLSTGVLTTSGDEDKSENNLCKSADKGRKSKTGAVWLKIKVKSEQFRLKLKEKLGKHV